MKRVINFMAVRNVAFVLTLLLTVASLASLAVKGLNFGLDFTGGTLVELNYENPVALEQIRGQLVEGGFDGALVQSFGATTDVLIRMPGDDPQLGERIAGSLRGQGAGGDVTVKRVEFVGPSVGEELRDQGGLGMLLAMAGILLYVTLRFQMKFAVAAIAALLHDVIFVLGFFAFFGLQFDLTVLAAVLAVIGYSLNDTIVVFDRV
ncbi:MAG: protein translocase subunit SecF, partial [Pseudomonadales bacterium 32-61-5]